jgi:hypothetical protein
MSFNPAASSTSPNYSQNLLHEIKKFYKNTNQLNILLRETNNACKELKILQQTTPLPGIYIFIIFYFLTP